MTFTIACLLFFLACLIAQLAFDWGRFKGGVEFHERYKLPLAEWHKKVMRDLDRKEKRRVT